VTIAHGTKRSTLFLAPIAAPQSFLLVEYITMKHLQKYLTATFA